jgi:RimJ/RimL family protein N-acetyltransferase
MAPWSPGLITPVAIPVIETERLRLRAPEIGDFPHYAAFLGSERAIHERGPMDERAAWREFCASLACWSLRGFGAWSVTERGGGAYLGEVGLFQPVEYAEPEIGWLVVPEAEGKGIAHEAALSVRQWAYRTLGLKTLVSYIAPANARSIRLAERLGAWLDREAPGPDAGDLVYRHPGPEAMS